MSARERVLAIRLISKILYNPIYADGFGIEGKIKEVDGRHKESK